MTIRVSSLAVADAPAPSAQVFADVHLARRKRIHVLYFEDTGGQIEATELLPLLLYARRLGYRSIRIADGSTDRPETQTAVDLEYLLPLGG